MVSSPPRAAARAAGDFATSLKWALEGLALFRGPVLVDAGDWASPHRNRLEELRLGLVEAAMGARVALGASGEVVAELGSLVEEHPLREGLWAALITALYRAGRQADALAAYSKLRRLLADELGVDPDTRLQSLERQVLQHSPDLDPPACRPWYRRGTCRGSPLIIGREHDVAEVVSAVELHRLVTVIGPGGVGKTQISPSRWPTADRTGRVWLVRPRRRRPSAGALGGALPRRSISGGERSLRERLSGPDGAVFGQL